METVNVENLLEKDYLTSVMENGGVDQVNSMVEGELHVGWESIIKGEYFYILDTDSSISIVFQNIDDKFCYEFIKESTVVLKNGQELNKDNGVMVFKRVLKKFQEKNNTTITITLKGGEL